MAAIPFQVAGALLYVWGCGFTYAYALMDWLPDLAVVSGVAFSALMRVALAPVWLLLAGIGALGGALNNVSIVLDAQSARLRGSAPVTFSNDQPWMSLRLPELPSISMPALGRDDSTLSAADPNEEGRELARQQMLQRALKSTAVRDASRRRPVRPPVTDPNEVVARVKATQKPVTYTMPGTEQSQATGGSSSTTPSSSSTSDAAVAAKRRVPAKFLATQEKRGAAGGGSGGAAAQDESPMPASTAAAVRPAAKAAAPPQKPIIMTRPAATRPKPSAKPMNPFLPKRAGAPPTSAGKAKPPPPPPAAEVEETLPATVGKVNKPTTVGNVSKGKVNKWLWKGATKPLDP